VLGWVSVEHVLGHVRAHGVHPGLGGVDDSPDLVDVFADRRIGQHLLGHRVVGDQPPCQPRRQPHVVHRTLLPQPFIHRGRVAQKLLGQLDGRRRGHNHSFVALCWVGRRRRYGDDRGHSVGCRSVHRFPRARAICSARASWAARIPAAVRVAAVARRWARAWRTSWRPGPCSAPRAVSRAVAASSACAAALGAAPLGRGLGLVAACGAQQSGGEGQVVAAEQPSQERHRRGRVCNDAGVLRPVVDDLVEVARVPPIPGWFGQSLSPRRSRVFACPPGCSGISEPSGRQHSTPGVDQRSPQTALCS